ncbi:geranylgeranyl diphosphate synthase, type II [Carnobacterium iners]|uniref:Farnesyl diphosphate synthase n=1 Tax=Carnobacterium iners TaxID=1073423 RepID=A0A1X7NR22_9LACT|nr:farnesyl diphosphate synthase [Carnobacterium iners]SEL16394.1 geranylgeranyl diphosphate synthase, type II [Carnobacterium iners]SMH40532.1 geranylgeranyl diphosphate synthase, type II [Carnobacterium iners]
MEFSLFEKREKPLIEAALIEFLDKSTYPKGTLSQAMRYSLTAGGKRIRPLLLLATVHSLGGDMSKSYEIATALEYIHTYSLVHDDLPAMDNDALRRGKPTNHKVYGEDIAILAGDGLLTQAFEIASKGSLSDTKKVALILALAKAAGPMGMVAGQTEDIEGENQQVPLEALKAIHEKKTGELLRFSVYAGGLIADAPSTVSMLLNEFAAHFGLAFQILDDILDVIGDSKELGKKTGMDVTLNKSTYPALLSLVGAKAALEDELMSARKNLIQIGDYYKQKGSHFDSQLLSDMLNLLQL